MTREELIEIAETLEELLGPTFNHAYEAAYRSILVGNILAWVAGFLLLALTWATYRGFRRRQIEVRAERAAGKKSYDINDDDLIFRGAALGVPPVVAFIVLGTALHDLVARDWIIIRQLLHLI